MKMLKTLSAMALLASLLTNCKKDTQIVTDGFPDQIIVTIPDAISSTNQTKDALVDACGIPFSGDSIYQGVRGFIKVGKTSAILVQDIFSTLRKFNIDGPTNFEFTGKDGNQKKVIVGEITGANATGAISSNYTMKLTLTDKADTTKIGMQIFWNKETKEGFTILCPYILNKKDAFALQNPDLKYRVDFTPVKTSEYDQKMEVTLSGFAPSTEKFAMSKLKMVVTKQGSIVTIKGNSNHPNAYFVRAADKGLSYAFVAKGESDKNIGVIKLALPSITLNSTDVFSNFSIEKVMNNEINLFAELNSLPLTEPYFLVCVSQLLVNCKSPAYFSAEGYKGSGATKPTADFNGEISVLDGLAPFAPAEVENINLMFQ